MFNTSLGTFSCHNLVLFLYFPCNKILLNFRFACIMFLFLFFLFHDLNLEWSLLLFLSWFRNPIDMVVFVPITIRTKLQSNLFSSFFLVILLFRDHVYIYGRSPCYPQESWTWKSSILWMCCSFANQSSFNLFGMCFHNSTPTKCFTY